MPLLHRKPAPVPLAFSPLVDTRSLARYQAGGHEYEAMVQHLLRIHGGSAGWIWSVLVDGKRPGFPHSGRVRTQAGAQRAAGTAIAGDVARQAASRP